MSKREKKQSSHYIISLPSSNQSGAGAKAAGLRSISRAPSFQRVGQPTGALAVTNTIYCTWREVGGTTISRGPLITQRNAAEEKRG